MLRSQGDAYSFSLLVKHDVLLRLQKHCNTHIYACAYFCALWIYFTIGKSRHDEIWSKWSLRQSVLHCVAKYYIVICRCWIGWSDVDRNRKCQKGWCDVPREVGWYDRKTIIQHFTPPVQLMLK